MRRAASRLRKILEIPGIRPYADGASEGEVVVTNGQCVGSPPEAGLNLLMEEMRVREEAQRADAERHREFRTYWGRRLRELLRGRP
jgi:hypothetical protein